MGHRRVVPLIAALLAATVALAALTGCSLLGGEPSGSKGAAVPPPVKPAAATKRSSASVAVTVPPTAAEDGISLDVDGIKAREIVAAGGRLVDVRSRAEWSESRIKGADSVPMFRFAAAAQKWDRARPVVVYDQSGAQSQSAQVWLERNGFKAVYHLFRGLDGWDGSLVGTDPKPIPAHEPVLYYLYGSEDFVPALPTLPSDRARVIAASDAFVAQLKKDLDGEFEYHAYDVATSRGLEQLADFAGNSVPMFVLVDERGRTEQYVGLDAQAIVNSHLKRAVERFKASQQ